MAPSLTQVSRAGTALLARASSGRRMLPSFLVVGGKRCGSTSLYEYISEHPDVLGARAKKGTHYFDVNYSRGWAWFRSMFPLPRPGKMTGEASPYYMFHPHAPDRIAAALPDVKLIAVLRNPVTRAWSHYQYETRRGHEDLSFMAALDREPERLAGVVDKMRAEPGFESSEHRWHTYLARGRYAEQVERLHALFGRERLLVLQSEAMFADPDTELARVWDFLGLAPYRLRDPRPHKAGTYTDAPPPEAATRLSAYYAEPNEQFYRITGVGFRWPTADAAAGPGSLSPR